MHFRVMALESGFQALVTLTRVGQLLWALYCRFFILLHLGSSQLMAILCWLGARKEPLTLYSLSRGQAIDALLRIMVNVPLGSWTARLGLSFPNAFSSMRQIVGLKLELAGCSANAFPLVFFQGMLKFNEWKLIVIFSSMIHNWSSNESFSAQKFAKPSTPKIFFP